MAARASPNARASDACDPSVPLSETGSPTTTSSAPCLRARSAIACGSGGSTTPSGRAIVPVGSEIAHPARAAPGSTARIRTLAGEPALERLAGHLERPVEVARVALPARLSDVVAAAPATAGDRGRLAHDARGGESALDRFLGEARDDRKAPVVDAADHHRSLAEPR